MRLVDADKLVKQIPKTSVDIFENCRNCRLLDDLEVRMIISNAPTIEAEPVKHGHWIAVENGNDGDAKCSRCGCYHHVWEAYGYYCQHCGAKMDEVEE